MSKQSFAIGGVHPHDNKLARDCQTQVLPPAPTYTFDPADGIWKRNTVDALSYGARIL